MAYIAPAGTYWQVECLADSQILKVTFYTFNESETSDDDIADAIRNALDALPNVVIVEARKYGITSASF